MYSFERSAAEPAGTADGLDRLLHDFYQSEMPHPWPGFQAPARTLPLPVKAKSSRWSQARSHFALAATIALLLLGCLFLSEKLAVGPAQQGPGAADPLKGANTEYNSRIIKEEKAIEKSMKTGFNQDKDGTEIEVIIPFPDSK